MGTPTPVTETVYDYSSGNLDGKIIAPSGGKMSGYGGTPITIPSSSSQALVTEGGTATVGCTAIASLQSLGIANKTLINEIRNNLVSLNIINGAA